MKKNKFRIYISHLNEQTLSSIDQLKTCLDTQFGGDYELEVIDVLNNPGNIKEQDEVFATPTFIKVSPDPVKKVVGDIARKDKILKLILDEE